MSGILRFLGIDSGFGKSNNSAIYIKDNKVLLIDCGCTVFTKLQEHGLLRRDYDYDVIITHMHPDHFCSLGQLAGDSYYVFHKSINVMSECENLDMVMTATGVGNNVIPPGPDYPKQMYTKINRYNVKFIKTEHVPNLDCYGFIAQIGEKRIVYTGDTRTLKPFMEYLDSDTEFYVEASVNGGVHLDIHKNFANLLYIANNSAGLYLMHLDDKDKIADAIKGTKIQIAEEF